MSRSDEEIRVLLNAGKDAYAAGEYEKAVKNLSEFVAERTGFADVYNILGQAYYYMGKPKEAVEAFKKSMGLNPRYTEAGINLAVTLFDIGRYEEAAEIQEKMNASAERRTDGLDPYALKKLANKHAELGDAYHTIGLFDQAIEEYVKSLHLAPQFPDVRRKLAEAYRDKGMYDEAVKELTLLKEAQPNYMPARVALGVTYYSMCRIPDAIDEWKHVTDIDPTNKAANAYLKLVPPSTTCK